MPYTPEIEAERIRLGQPPCRLVGEDGNAFAIMGRVMRSLRRAGYSPEAVKAYQDDSTSGDYNHLLYVAMEWVEDVGEEDEDDE